MSCFYPDRMFDYLSGGSSWPSCPHALDIRKIIDVHIIVESLVGEFGQNVNITDVSTLPVLNPFCFC
jgi:hypothetical protein